METSLPLSKENSIIIIISIDLKIGQWTEWAKSAVYNAPYLFFSITLLKDQVVMCHWGRDCFLCVEFRLSCPFLTIELITRPTYLGSPLRDTSMAGS